MHASERMIEHDQAAVAREVAATIGGVQRTLAQPGAADCIQCGDPISAARRQAMPSARRCTECQRRADGETRGRR